MSDVLMAACDSPGGRWHIFRTRSLNSGAPVARCVRRVMVGAETQPAINVPRHIRCQYCGGWPEHPSYAASSEERS